MSYVDEVIERVVRENTAEPEVHQAVKEVAPGMIATGWSEDGLIEAIEHPGSSFALGVQWHPEIGWEKDKFSQAIFKQFIETKEACWSNRTLMGRISLSYFNRRDTDDIA